MAYIGKTPVIGNFQKCDSIAVVNGQAAYTLQVGGTNVSPQSENHMLVSLNGILQAPVDSFTVSGSTLTFASNLITGDVIDFVMILGNVLDLGVPSDNTVSLAKLTATGTKDSTTFLRGDNSFAEVPAGGITEADQWRLSADTNQGTNAVISSNWERVDNNTFNYIGTGMTQSSGVWTFPSTGIWLVRFKGYFTVNSSDLVIVYIQTTLNNSTYGDVAGVYARNLSGSDNDGFSDTAETYIDVTNTSNVKVRFSTDSMGGSSVVQGDTADNETFATFIRLGDT